MSYTAYGIEVTGGRVTVARSRYRKGAWITDIPARRLDPANDPAWTALAAEINREQQQLTAVVGVAASAQDSVVRVVEAPFADRKKAEAVLPSLLDVQLPFPLEQCRHGFVFPQPVPGRNVRAVALAMPQDRLPRIIEECRAVLGIDPDAVIPEAAALWHYQQVHLPAASSRPRIWLHLGLDRMTGLVTEGGVPVQAFGARGAWSDDGNENAARLLARVRMFLAGALKEQSAGGECVISGPLAETVGSALCAQLGLDAATRLTIAEPDSVLAVALAEAGHPRSGVDINLRRGPDSHPLARRRADRTRNRLLARVAAGGLLLAVGSQGATAWLSIRHDHWQRDIRREAAALTGIAALPRGQEVFIARQHLAAPDERYAPFQEWLAPDATAWFNRLTRIARARGMTLEQLSIRADAITVRGTSTDWNDPDAIANALAEEGWRMELERSDAGADERVPFTVRAQR
ncbi:MAG TPA: hypothetical protein PKE26_10635 [Kiritimatiellia bacterium]|nr:hypothetical protein [Kiritimatiellia bacterium]HMO99554.1 hypothetical protein [Kiritimatiellia bacterium]HMP97452.1 hypothetical protein [Kiritimatiellia bacterium]